MQASYERLNEAYKTTGHKLSPLEVRKSAFAEARIAYALDHLSDIEPPCAGALQRSRQTTGGVLIGPVDRKAVAVSNAPNGGSLGGPYLLGMLCSVTGGVPGLLSRMNPRTS